MVVLAMIDLSVGLEYLKGRSFFAGDDKLPLRFQLVSSLYSSDIDFFSLLLPAWADNKFAVAAACQVLFYTGV